MKTTTSSSSTGTPPRVSSSVHTNIGDHCKRREQTTKKFSIFVRWI